MNPQETLLVEFGMGTSLRRGDYTQAARRAVQNALWRNSINLAQLFDVPKDTMRIRLDISVQQPEKVDVSDLAADFPYGHVDIHVSHGGLDIEKPNGVDHPTIIANAAFSVSLNITESGATS